MTQYNTGNPVGSSAVKDLHDNSVNFDNLVNGKQPEYNDRLGQPRKSWSGLQNELVSTVNNYVADPYSGGANQKSLSAGLASYPNRFLSAEIDGSYLSNWGGGGTVIRQSANNRDCVRIQGVASRRFYSDVFQSKKVAASVVIEKGQTVKTNALFLLQQFDKNGVFISDVRVRIAAGSYVTAKKYELLADIDENACFIDWRVQSGGNGSSSYLWVTELLMSEGINTAYRPPVDKLLLKNQFIDGGLKNGKMPLLRGNVSSLMIQTESALNSIGIFNLIQPNKDQTGAKYAYAAVPCEKYRGKHVVMGCYVYSSSGSFPDSQVANCFLASNQSSPIYKGFHKYYQLNSSLRYYFNATDVPENASFLAIGKDDIVDSDCLVSGFMYAVSDNPITIDDFDWKAISPVTFGGVSSIQDGSDANLGAVSADSITASTLVMNIPAGDSMPSNVEINQAWLDTTTGTVKVRLS